MAADHTTAVRIDLGIDHTTEPAIASRIRTLALLVTYAGLWVGFTLGGVFTAIWLAELASGLLGTALLVTVGLGAVVAGPAVARRTMAAILDRHE